MCFKGIKMNPEMEGFHHGVDKCKETISNIVRCETISNRNSWKTSSYSRKQDIFAFQGIQAFLEFYLRETQPKKKFSCIDATHKTKSKKVLMAGGKTKKPKGLRKRPNRMSVDKMFLRNLATQLSDMDIAGPWGESVTNKAQIRFERHPRVHKLFLNIWSKQNHGRQCLELPSV